MDGMCFESGAHLDASSSGQSTTIDAEAEESGIGLFQLLFARISYISSMYCFYRLCPSATNQTAIALRILSPVLLLPAPHGEPAEERGHTAVTRAVSRGLTSRPKFGQGFTEDRIRIS